MKDDPFGPITITHVDGVGINRGDIVTRQERRNLPDKILAFVLACVLPHRLTRPFKSFVKYEVYHYTVTAVTPTTITIEDYEQS